MKNKNPIIKKNDDEHVVIEGDNIIKFNFGSEANNEDNKSNINNLFKLE